MPRQPTPEKTDQRVQQAETAQKAYAPALTPRQNRVRTILDRLGQDPPQVLILEGGEVDERFSLALWYAARLNCPSTAPPCLDCINCDICRLIGAYNAEVLTSDAKDGASGEKSILTNFNNLCVLDGREATITVNTIHELRRILAEAPHDTGKRVVILAEAQALSNNTPNMLLKMLEEPPAGVCFLLLTPQRERLLPTLVSRSWVATLAWPETGASAQANLQIWLDELTTFISTGRGWLERTAAKGAVDTMLARQIIVALQKAQIAALTRPEENTLSDILRTLSAGEHLYLTDVLNQCQESINYGVKPALSLGWLGTQLYAICHTARKKKGDNQTDSPLLRV